MRKADDMASVDGLLEPILSLHNAIRDAVMEACAKQSSDQLAAVSDDSGAEGDTIYAIDRVSEEALVRGLSGLARQEPLCIVAEGIAGGSLVLPRGTTAQDCRWQLLVDPL